MAKVTITIEDAGDDSITVTLKFDPPISLLNIEKPTHAIKTASSLINKLKNMGETKLWVNGVESDFKL